MQTNNYPVPSLGMNNPLQQMTIKRLLLIVTRDSYQPVFNRTFTLNTNYETVNKLYDCVHHVDGSARQLNMAELSRNIPNIISLNPAVVGDVYIPNGWGTQRLRYILEVEHTSYQGLITTTFIQGFSEYHDPSMTGKIDPNMLFFINSTTNIDRWENPVHGVMPSSTCASKNILTELPGGNTSPVVDNDKVSVTPYDIHNNNYLDAKYMAGNGTIVKTSDKITSSTPKLSSKVNNNPYKYFSKTINDFITTTAGSEISHDLSDTYLATANYSREDYIVDHPFMAALNNLTGSFNPTSFTLGQLLQIEPGLETNNRITLIDRASIGIEDSFATMLNTEHTESALQPTHGNIKASLIANMLPSIMLDNLITDLSISMTNMTGEHVVIVPAANSFITNVYLQPYIERMVDQIKLQLFPLITDGYQNRFEAIISCDIVGDITIGISFFGQEHAVYRFPVFADSLYTPVIADRYNSDLLVNDFNTMLDATQTNRVQDLIQ